MLSVLFCLVVAVSDGDTLKLRCGEPGAYRPVIVRLGAIDAPELGQPFGQRAKRTLAALTHRKTVRLDCGPTDRYGRPVCKVLVAPASCTDSECPKTLDAGLAMLSTGMAWWSRAYRSEQAPTDRQRYGHAESEARGGRIGLWADAAAVPPWKWRAAHPRAR